jgi:branched-chain amino acid aminotransferase
VDIIRANHSRIGDVDFENLGFGATFSDHMFSLEYYDGKWRSPQIIPFGKIELLPSACSLHYGQMVFEGFKAFCTQNSAINVFRPDKHHERLNNSCRRLCIPEIDFELFMSGLDTLLNLDRAWIPPQKGSALYIRPLLLATESTLNVRPANAYRFIIMTSPVSPYFDRSSTLKLITTSEYARSAKGGLGAAKTPANYSAGLQPMQEAVEQGFDQILWLDGAEGKYVEEAGVMNIFFLIDDELITPPLEGTILPGVTRDTVIYLAKDWNIKVVERRISIDEVISASKEGRLQEAFGAGTAAIIFSIGQIRHHDHAIIINGGQSGRLSQRLYREITALHYGEKADKFGWCHQI